MRQLALLSILLLTGCTQIQVAGPYRASLSQEDVQSIAHIGQTIYPRNYTRLTLNAVGRDEVWVGAVSQGGSYFYDYSAVRRDGTWKRGRYTPPPMD